MGSIRGRDAKTVMHLCPKFDIRAGTKESHCAWSTERSQKEKYKYARVKENAANHNPHTARPATCRSALQKGVWMAAPSQQSYALRSCSSSLENLEQRPLGLGGILCKELDKESTQEQPVVCWRPPSQRWRVSVLLGRPGPNKHTERRGEDPPPPSPYLLHIPRVSPLTVSSAAAAAAASHIFPHPTSLCGCLGVGPLGVEGINIVLRWGAVQN
ncbi:hypothetical protein EYF80_008302 [Liparis tanakae]|uniref:Uncharacterized protein n=1 Tax=Liparis tanakae TaxID=230148 RepID=A0A4Z2IU69_9TELE|nr:hypothetical protein EYF80_008302 [Liparis tanakae]